MDISFILVEPTVPENIGASARAIKTMGFRNFCLVRPAVDYLDKKARILAHASVDILDDAKTYNCLKDVRDDFDLLIATSAKRRRTNENYIPADELATFLIDRGDSIDKAGIVFGREESGLTNEEIRKCDLISYIPLANPYPSLNLSQAVMIYAYLLSGILREDTNKKTAGFPEESLQVLKEKVKEMLEKMDIKQPHIIGPRIMERMSYLKKEDISLLHSVTNAIRQKIKK
jgi:tRNA/rRNA methyltransferase